MGLDIYEFRPDAVSQARLMQRLDRIEKPKFSLHAKTVVVDSSKVFIGTFNLDPRSVNLNTETGVIIEHEKLAKEVEARINEDMLSESSWDARHDNPDQASSFFKRTKTFFWQLMPMKPIL